MKTTNKKIQEERVRNYFIQAAKKTLKGEGIKSVNVRTVAHDAGYSYATLYNYFKDIKELVFECVKEFKLESEEIINRETEKSKRGIPKIKDITNSYMKYFVQYPGIFELFYLERVDDLGYKNPTINLVYSLLDNLCKDEWNYCIEMNIYTKKDTELKKELLRNTITGILLFYLNRYTPTSYKEFVNLTNRQINNILK